MLFQVSRRKAVKRPFQTNFVISDLRPCPGSSFETGWNVTTVSPDKGRSFREKGLVPMGLFFWAAENNLSIFLIHIRVDISNFAKKGAEEALAPKLSTLDTGPYRLLRPWNLPRDVHQQMSDRETSLRRLDSWTILVDGTLPRDDQSQPLMVDAKSHHQGLKHTQQKIRNQVLLHRILAWCQRRRNLILIGCEQKRQVCDLMGAFVYNQIWVLYTAVKSKSRGTYNSSQTLLMEINV